MAWQQPTVGSTWGARNRNPVPTGQGFMDMITGWDPGTLEQLRDTISGANLHGNPYLDATFSDASSAVTDQFNNQVLPNIAAQFAMAGRGDPTGQNLQGNAVSTAAGNLTDSLASLSNQIYGGNYQSERDRQMQALGQMGQLFGLAGDMWSGQQDRSVALQGQANQANIAAGNRQNALTIAEMSDAFNRWNSQENRGLEAAGLGADIWNSQVGHQQNALSMIPGLLGMGNASDLAGIQGLLQAGGLMEGYDQRAIDDAMARWNFDQQSPWDNVARFGAIVGNPIMESFSQSSGSSRGGGGSTFGNILGTGLAIASMIPGPHQPLTALGSMGAGAMLGGGNHNSPLMPANNPAAQPWYAGGGGWMNPGY